MRGLRLSNIWLIKLAKEPLQFSYWPSGSRLVGCVIQFCRFERGSNKGSQNRHFEKWVNWDLWLRRRHAVIRRWKPWWKWSWTSYKGWTFERSNCYFQLQAYRIDIEPSPRNIIPKLWPWSWSLYECHQWHWRKIRISWRGIWI